MPRRTVLPWLTFFCVLWLGLTTSATTRPSSTAPSIEDQQFSSSTAGAEDLGGEDFDYATRWLDVDRLRSEDKYAAASEVVEEILARASGSANEEEWTRALVRLVQLRTALHGYETAVRNLQDQEWPKSFGHRAVLELFYAHGLVTYLHAYSWEISQRDTMETGGELDLRTWTRDQIFTEAQTAFLRLWEQRESWGDEGLGRYSEYLSQNNYPARIRGTFRDAFSYLWVELLSDSGFWRPRHNNQVYRLERQTLIDAGVVTDLGVDLSDPQTHPLVKIAVVLDDLESWHRFAGRAEAAFEARLVRLQRLHSALDQADDRAAIRQNLQISLDDLGIQLPWWSMGQAQLAEFVQQESSADALIRARDLATTGERAHPTSLGGLRCGHLVAAIEAPHFDITAMQNDGLGRRSILIRHKNLETVHFRAYRFDLVDEIESSRDYNLLPGHREVPEIIKGRLPVAEWTEPLEPTLDFRLHQAFSMPSMDAPGLYIIVGSARRNFSPVNNRVVAVNLVVGDLVLLSRHVEDGFEVQVRSGSSGDSLAGVEVLLYRFDYRRGHRRVASSRTDGSGEVTLAGPGRSQDRYFVVARQGDEIALDPNGLWRLQSTIQHARTAALVYTDRSVYRPRQRLQWKVVGYQMDGEGEAKVLANQSIQVQLMDANHQLVESRQVKSNSFGTASGEFEIPSGRLLGRWRLQTSLGGNSEIRVEEYKRPTFEVAIEEPVEALRLNRNAALRGEAGYYFGLPVVDGEVSWQVERVPIYPYWWWSWRPVTSSPEIVASGETRTDSEGSFQVAFLPQADERQSESVGVSYSFRLRVDVVDDGGETRSSDRIFRLGFVTVQASIESDVGFHRTDEPVELRVRRSDLDGIPRSGSGHWELYRLREPEETLLPADQPVLRESLAFPDYATTGDLLRARWGGAYSVEQVLRRWEISRNLKTDRIEHDVEGIASVELGRLQAGAYRLTYRTEDEFGAVFESAREFIVVESGRSPVPLPVVFLAERPSVEVGGTARFLVQSGLEDQQMMLEVYRDGRRIRRQVLISSHGTQIVEFPIRRQDRGGFGVRLTAVRDHQLMSFSQSVFVPWQDRELSVSFASFRDLLRPGNEETWRVEVKGREGDPLSAGAAEILAYMYDRSLDIFAPHRPPDIVSVYPNRTGIGPLQVNLGGRGEIWSRATGFGSVPGYPRLVGDRLIFFDGYGIGGPGRRGLAFMAKSDSSVPRSAGMAMDAAAPAESREVLAEEMAPELERKEGVSTQEAEPLRSDFSETAFWEPHLLLGDDGSVAFEFTVPDSVTEWNVWVHAVSRDLQGGSVHEETRSAKDLMVRPYLPRFLREGDLAQLRVVVNNASDGTLSGSLDFEIRDPDSGESLLADFGLDVEATQSVPFTVAGGGSTDLTLELIVPSRVGEVVVEVRGRAGDWSDGERRPLPLLPGRMHLIQSRFAALEGGETRELHFADMANDDDPSLLHEQLVVNLDAQLFYGVLQALPYLASFPYECTEQTMNRFVSTGIVTSLYDSYPAVAQMAKEFAQRETRFETWDGVDANRKMALVETPWLQSSQGGVGGSDDLINVLDPRIANAERRAALAKLQKVQTSLGGFPWWPGGPPSPYMTLYLLHGFSRALEFDIEIPKELVTRAWGYMHRHFLDELVQKMMGRDCCWETITFLNYVLSSYPDDSWTGGVFSDLEREKMLEFSFRHWRRHSPMLKSYLALTLQRADRSEDASLVFQSVMDSSRTTRDEGTFWAPEERSWLWYNDTIETHAFALRTLTEIDPDDDRRHGLVHWLFLNKKLNHWKSTRATAEVIYSLVHYLDQEGQLGEREAAQIRVGRRQRDFVFEPDSYTGHKNQWVISGPDIDPIVDSTIAVETSTPGLMFASATWHFSTEKMPEEARGDFFAVERRFFRRLPTSDGWVLRPLDEGEELEIGDQVEVHLSLRTRHAAEYVHLRDPRGAGFEPVNPASGYKWNLGLGWYEEIRDSGTNFFFDWLPVGEYTFKYQVRVAMAGRFKVAPAVLQSMYAPEFTAYSAGAQLSVEN